LLHLVGIISLLSMMHGTTNIKFTTRVPNVLHTHRHVSQWTVAPFQRSGAAAKWCDRH